MSATDSVADLLALYIAMVAEDIHTGVIANILSHSKKKEEKKEISFFFFSWNIWSERAASTNVKNVQILRLDDIKNHEADMLGFKTLRLNLYRLLKTHQMSIMSLEKKTCRVVTNTFIWAIPVESINTELFLKSRN